MYKYDNNFKATKKVRINDSDDQKIDDLIRIPVKILKNSEVHQTERSRRHVRNDYPKSRNYDIDSSEERDVYYGQRRRNHRGRSYFNPLLGDNFVDRKLTRTFVYYRPPFDWYNTDRCEILDEYEEILMPERPVYSREHSDDSIYDRLDRHNHDYAERERNRQRKEPIYDSGSERKKRNGLRTKEIVTERELEIEEENLFSFEDRDNRSSNDRNGSLKKNRQDNLNQLVDNFNDITIDERKRYRKSNKRY